MTGISFTGNPTRGRTARTFVGLRKIFVTGVAAILFASVASAADVAGTARLIRERRAHTATAIGNGKILVAGGQNLSGALSDVEIFDSATGTFTAAAQMLTSRAEHTATRLADGRVILIGGRGTEPLVSTELFDPFRNVFSSGPSLNSSRFGHTATILPDGRIVVIGGNAEGTAEVFDPRAGTFSALPCRLHEPRSFHASVRLLDGSILIAGGIARDGATLKSAEVLHPDTLECERIATPMFAARSHFVLRMLPDGKVQAIGGDAERTMELFNPAGYFSSLAHLAGTAESESAALRNPGRAAIIGPSARTIPDGPASVTGGREAVRLVQSLLDRSDHSLTELPEAGVAIAVGGVSSAGRYQQTAVLFESSAATVTTDKTDYAPGETVVITGTGWQPGETVDLNVHRDNDNPPDTWLTAVADGDGNIQNTEFVVQESDIGVTFLLTATGQTSGFTAQTTFTDGNVRIRTGAAGTTFDLYWEKFSTTTCAAGTVIDSDTETNVGFSGGAQHTEGVGNTESISLTAEAFSNEGGAFIGWTSETPPNPSTPPNPTPALTICVPGFTGGGTREYVANYGPAGACFGQPSGTECRASAGACDVAETCDGVSPLCPADSFQPNTFECRSAAGVCDTAESCTGSSAECPADAKSTAECRGSAGVCDTAESCDGASNDCPADAFQPTTTECRASVGVCDTAESCTGSSAECPADGKSTAECRASAGTCDVAESCDGASNDCPADAFQPPATVCRPEADECDTSESCSGTDAQCPADGFDAPGTACTDDGNVCTTDVCSGTGVACTHPAGNAGTECRGAAGVCDAAESCDGVNTACPADDKRGPETTCRPAAGFCDVAESCNGVSNDCPPDAFQPPTTVCRPEANECDIAERCTGSSALCPPDALQRRVFLVIDEESIDNGNPPNYFSANEVNDHIARVGLRSELPYFAAHENQTITLHTGTVGDEGWFAPKTIPLSWNTAGPTPDGLRNYILAGPGLGSGRNPEKLLDKVRDVTPLRATGLEMLEGSCVCAVVYDSDVSINYGPLNGSLKGANLGLAAFEVEDVTQLTGYSSGSLPKVEIEIRDAAQVCNGPLDLLREAPAPQSSSEPYDTAP